MSDQSKCMPLCFSHPHTYIRVIDSSGKLISHILTSSICCWSFLPALIEHVEVVLPNVLMDLCCCAGSPLIYRCRSLILSVYLLTLPSWPPFILSHSRIVHIRNTVIDQDWIFVTSIFHIFVVGVPIALDRFDLSPPLASRSNTANCNVIGRKDYYLAMKYLTLPCRQSIQSPPHFCWLNCSLASTVMNEMETNRMTALPTNGKNGLAVSY